MELKTPILDCIKKYNASKPARFHTPGHQGVFGGEGLFGVDGKCSSLNSDNSDIDAGRDSSCGFDKPELSFFGNSSLDAGGLFYSCGFDITELTFSDNLLHSSGIIEESEKQAAEFYGSKGTLFFTNGATSAIFTAIAAAASLKSGDCREASEMPPKSGERKADSFNDGLAGNAAASLKNEKNGKILVGKNCHKSVFSALSICGLTPIFYDLEGDGRGGFLPAKLENIERILRENSDKKRGIDPPFSERKKTLDLDGIKAVILTSPDYFGRCAEVGKIYEFLNERGILLIVDGAHGAHFPFSEYLPKHPAKFADFVVDGCHKTMPVYTGGALLHCGNGELRLRAEFFRSVFHSASPQYLTLASIDFSIAKLAKDGERAYADLYKRVEKLKAAIKSFDYSVFGEKDGDGDVSLKKTAEKALEKRGIKDVEKIGISLKKTLEKDGIERDFSRLVIDCFPYSGEELQSALEKKNIFAETVFGSLVVFILSPYNLSAIDRLENAFREIILEKKGKNPESSLEKTHKKDLKTLENLSPKKDKRDFSYFQGIEFVNISDSLFKISATEIGVYPPGIPTVFRGDIITRETLEYLLKNKDSLFGLTDGKIAVFA